MEDLPLDVQSKVLSCVHRESVLECKLVSKTWNTLLLHRKIAAGLLLSAVEWVTLTLGFGYYDDILRIPLDKHDEGESFYDKFTEIKHPFAEKELYETETLDLSLVSSCNGLVCLSMRRYIDTQYVSSFCVLNPLTGEYFNLPMITKVHEKSRVVCGFGYDPSGRNYKIARIEYPYSGLKDKAWVKIYTLGGSGWRDIGEINYNLLGKEGILWNGSFHWLDNTFHWFDKNKQYWKIVAFDLADENFRYLPTTPCNKKHTPETQLKLLGGYLSIVSMDRDNGRLDIWMLKNKQNNNDIVVEAGYRSWKWSLDFSISIFPSPNDYDSDSYEAYAITKSNQVLLWYKLHTQGRYNLPVFLCRYDPKNDTLNKVMHLGTCGVSHFQGIPHVNSLVSLKSLGVDSRTTAEVRSTKRAFPGRGGREGGRGGGGFGRGGKAVVLLSFKW
ncbi:F-box protein At3g07870-like [Papaver somniferum]|uniref:F-box protein At3g07870-like n=1 Tax=Papaver somniferum TaxID=3469 RepID=UPI000E6FE00C|nr:F-box protein At3g07870-like [Papaver somniferum]